MLDQQPYLNFRTRDGSGSFGLQRIHVRRGTEAIAAQSAATTLRSRLGGVSGCAYLEQQYVLPAVEEPVPVAEQWSEIRFCGVLIFSCEGEDQYFILAIPAINPALLETITPNSNPQLNVDDPTLAALIAELTNGQWCNPFGHVIVKLEAAYFQVRNVSIFPNWL